MEMVMPLRLARITHNITLDCIPLLLPSSIVRLIMMMMILATRKKKKKKKKKKKQWRNGRSFVLYSTAE